MLRFLFIWLIHIVRLCNPSAAHGLVNRNNRRQQIELGLVEGQPAAEQ